MAVGTHQHGPRLADATMPGPSPIDVDPFARGKPTGRAADGHHIDRHPGGRRHCGRRINPLSRGRADERGGEKPSDHVPVTITVTAAS